MELLCPREKSTGQATIIILAMADAMVVCMVGGFTVQVIELKVQVRLGGIEAEQTNELVVVQHGTR